jgi:hypothetical protein
MFIRELYLLFQRKPFLSRRYINKTLKSVVMNGDKVHTHLGYNTIAIYKQTMGIVRLSGEMPEKCRAVVDFTHYVHKSVSCFAYSVGFRVELSALFYLTVLYGYLHACFEKKRKETFQIFVN